MKKTIASSVLILLIFALLLLGCGGDSEDDDTGGADAGQPVDANAGEAVNPNSTQIAYIAVTATPTPIPSVTPTATLPYSIERFLGTYSIVMNIRFEGFAESYLGIEGVEDWSYRSLSEFRVDSSGSVLGQGTFSTRVYDNDLQCTIDILHDDLGYFITGAMRTEDSTEYMDIVLQPESLGRSDQEQYQINCLGADDPLKPELAFLWPTLAQATNLSFALPVSEGVYTINDTVSLADGQVHITLEVLR